MLSFLVEHWLMSCLVTALMLAVHFSVNNLRAKGTYYPSYLKLEHGAFFSRLYSLCQEDSLEVLELLAANNILIDTLLVATSPLALQGI